MKKLVLIMLAVIVKILSAVTVGLIFTNNIATYVSIVSRTHPLTIRFLLYIFSLDLIALLIIVHIAKLFFSISQTIRQFLYFSVVVLIAFWLSDVFFLAEVKSGEMVQHLFTLAVLLAKYIAFLLLSTSYILQIHKIDSKLKQELFLNYDRFPFKLLIGKRLFLLSKSLYNNTVLCVVCTVLLLYVNVLSMHLYSKSLIFYCCVLFCGIAIYYLMLLVIHQLSVVLNIYVRYSSKKVSSP